MSQIVEQIQIKVGRSPHTFRIINAVLNANQIHGGGHRSKAKWG